MPLSSGAPPINMRHCEARIIWGEFNKDNILKHKKEDIEPMEDMTVHYGQNRVKRGEGLLKMDKVVCWEPFYGSWELQLQERTSLQWVAVTIWEVIHPKLTLHPPFHVNSLHVILSWHKTRRKKLESGSGEVSRKCFTEGVFKQVSFCIHVEKHTNIYMLTSNLGIKFSSVTSNVTTGFL